jgi:hypothetical protein
MGVEGSILAAYSIRQPFSVYLAEAVHNSPRKMA